MKSSPTNGDVLLLELMLGNELALVSRKWSGVSNSDIAKKHPPDVFSFVSLQNPKCVKRCIQINRVQPQELVLLEFFGVQYGAP